MNADQIVETATAYISIGNSDDKLTQSGWADFVSDVRTTLLDLKADCHGEWFSLPSSPWQNACWCVEIPVTQMAALRHQVARLARTYRQNSIAYAASRVEFIGPAEQEEVHEVRQDH